MQKKNWKSLLLYNNRFAVQQLKKLWGKLKNTFVSPSKKCQSYNFHMWELYDKHFFQKTKTSVFYHQTVL